MTQFGVHSEVGTLRKVMVCRPGLAHLRLTPDNCKDLLFDDVIWVQEAKNEHYKFVEVMRDRSLVADHWIGVDVLVEPGSPIHRSDNGLWCGHADLRHCL